jgi:hypothetical protein
MNSYLFMQLLDPDSYSEYEYGSSYNTVLNKEKCNKALRSVPLARSVKIEGSGSAKIIKNQRG